MSRVYRPHAERKLQNHNPVTVGNESRSRCPRPPQLFLREISRHERRDHRSFEPHRRTLKTPTTTLPTSFAKRGSFHQVHIKVRFLSMPPSPYRPADLSLESLSMMPSTADSRRPRLRRYGHFGRAQKSPERQNAGLQCIASHAEIANRGYCGRPKVRRSPLEIAGLAPAWPTSILTSLTSSVTPSEL